MLLDWDKLATFLRYSQGEGRKYRDRQGDNADPTAGLLDHASFVYEAAKENPLSGAFAAGGAPGYNLIKQSVAEGRSPTLAYLPGFNFHDTKGSSPPSMNDALIALQALGIGTSDYVKNLAGYQPNKKSLVGRKLQDDEKFPIQRLLEYLP